MGARRFFVLTDHDHMWNVTWGSFSLLVGGHLGYKMRVAFWLQFLLQVEVLGLGVLGAILAPSWGVGGNLGSKLGVFGAILAPSWEFWGLARSPPDNLEGILAPGWMSWAPFWFQVGRSWGHLGSKLRGLGSK